MKADRFDYNDPNDAALGFLTQEHDYSADLVNRGKLTLRWQGGFLLWDRSYRSVADAEIAARVSKYLYVNECKITRRHLADILAVLAGLVRIDDRLEPPCWLDGANGAEVVTLQNGNYSLTDQRLLPHSPLYYSRLAPLPFNYDPDADCPTFKGFLASVLSADWVTFVEELLGYLFVGDNRYQAFFVFLGPGGNGKSTLVSLMEWIAGPANVAHVPVGRIGDRFSSADMVGMRINTSIENIGHVKEGDEATIKAMTGGDSIGAERKFVQGRKSFTPSAKLVISTNTMPRFRDVSAGLWRRLWIIPFNVSIPDDKQDRKLSDKLKTEGPGIFNMALRGHERLLHQGGFSVPGERVALLDQIRREVDPIRDFLLTTCRESRDGEFLVCSRLYDAYTMWAHSVGVPLVDGRLFGRRVRDVFPQSDRKQRGPRGFQEWCYIGLGLRTPGPPTNSYIRAQGVEREGVEN